MDMYNSYMTAKCILGRYLNSLLFLIENLKYTIDIIEINE